MSLDEKFIPVRTAFYNFVENFFIQNAQYYGYPDNPGMPTVRKFAGDSYYRDQFLSNLPVHRGGWPPLQRPETWFEMIVGPLPKIEAVPRYIYENKAEGFYNFYIENYKNIYFLPDWLSEFIQVKLNICLDLTSLELIRELVFLLLVGYMQVVTFRITLAWFISVNPYTVPWCYIVSMVDWTEDMLNGIFPSVIGINVSGVIFLGILGAIADSLNHIVFTMPFLPSEAVKTKFLISQQMKDVLVFHYLPILWYRHPIPNDIREFWYKERPDILEYMQKAYKDVDLQVLPDSVIKELNQPAFVTNLFFDSNSLINIDTSFNFSFSADFLPNSDFILTNFNFMTPYIEKFL